MRMPLIISTWSFGQRGNEAAWPALRAGGSSLDAVERACCTIEADPDVDSVGYGGLPDRDGCVSLDACIMLSPARCGSVCNVRRHLHVTSIARAVMERTPHIMLAGAQADDFADACGLPAASADLLSPQARLKWEQWKLQSHEANQSRDSGTVNHGLRPIDSGGADGGQLFTIGAQHGEHLDAPRRAHSEADWKHHDTIGVLALDARGELAGACSTSGTPFKTPGRVGDSPIIGHGLYVDPLAGAAAATGTGELIMSVCGSFLVVEQLRRGSAPVDAIRFVLQRIIDSHELRDHHQVALIALTPQGQFASAALRSGFKMSITSADRHEIADSSLVVFDDESKQ